MSEPRLVGTCPGCDRDVISGQGVRVDPDGRHWHPDCRVNRRSTQTEAGSTPAPDAPKRRGRPPKQRPEQQ